MSSAGVGEQPLEFRYVADDRSASMLAWANLVHAHRTLRQWVFYALLLVVFAGILFLTFDDDATFGARLFWGLVLGLPVTALTALLVSVIAYVKVRRGARLRVFPGAVLESSFGSGAVLLRNPLGESRIDYRAIRSVRVRGRAAFLRQHGVGILAIYPRELFPEPALDRIRRVSRP